MLPVRNCASERGHATNSSPLCRSDAPTIPHSGKKVASCSPATSVIDGRPCHTPIRTAVLTGLLVRLVVALGSSFALGQRGEDGHRLLADFVEARRELVDGPTSVLAHVADFGRLIPHRDASA